MIIITIYLLKKYISVWLAKSLIKSVFLKISKKNIKEQSAPSLSEAKHGRIITEGGEGIYQEFVQH